MVFKRADWNQIIQQVNAVLANPPAGCDPLPLLDEVGPNTIWAKSHVRAVQDALKATCPTIAFPPIPDLWKQSIIDDINSAMTQAWCDCEDDECTPAKVAEEHGLDFTIWTPEGPTVASNCFNNDGTIPLKSVIDGVQFGQHGVFSRVWRVFERVVRYNDSTLQNQIAVGIMPCTGIVSYSGSAQLQQSFGPCVVFCPNCGSPTCQSALATCQNRVDNPQPTDAKQMSYHLVIETSGASCALPGECP